MFKFINFLFIASIALFLTACGSSNFNSVNNYIDLSKTKKQFTSDSCAFSSYILNTSSAEYGDIFIEQVISLIDLHRMQIRKRTPKRWKHKDLSALYYSAINSGFNQRDAFCFMREYKQGFLKQIINDDPTFWELLTKKDI